MSKVTRWTWKRIEDLHNRHENGTSQAQLAREEQVCSPVIARLLHKFKRYIVGRWRREEVDRHGRLGKKEAGLTLLQNPVPRLQENAVCQEDKRARLSTLRDQRRERTMKKMHTPHIVRSTKTARTRWRNRWMNQIRAEKKRFREWLSAARKASMIPHIKFWNLAP